MSTTVRPPPGDPCLCGSGKNYAACCGRYLDAGKQPAAAEALMRSRYSAYCLNREDYLLETWHSSTRPGPLNLNAQTPCQWTGLKVRNTAGGGPGDTTGSVAFVARYKVNGKAFRLAETSRFVREDGRWVYLDGETS